MKKTFSPSILLIPTLKCQASCKYCFTEEKNGEMNLKQWKDILVFLKTLTSEFTIKKKLNITFHGGEPLLKSPEYYRIIFGDLKEYFFNFHLNIGLQSNLWNFNKDYLELFKKYKVHISTSLDGPEKINDRQRGSGYFEKSWEAIKFIRKEDIPIGVISTFTSQSYEEWEQIINFFTKQRLSLKIHPAVPRNQKHKISENGNRSTSLVLSPNKYYDLLKQMYEFFKNNYHKLTIEPIHSIINYALEKGTKECFMGGCLGTRLAITPSGDLYPCQRFVGIKNYRIGNINDPDIFISIKSAFKGTNPNYFPSSFSKNNIEFNPAFFEPGCPYQGLVSNLKTRQDPYWFAIDSLINEIKSDYIKETIQFLEMEGVIDGKNNLTRKTYFRQFPLLLIQKSRAEITKLARNANRIVISCFFAKNLSISQIISKLNELGYNLNNSLAYHTIKSFKQKIFIHELNNIYIHLTWNCNLNCSHCYAPINPSEKDGRIRSFSLKSNRFIEILLEAQRLGFNKCVFTGGEPSLHPKFDKFLEELQKNKEKLGLIDLSLRTNFTTKIISSKKLLRKMALIFDEVIVSVDGNQKIHDKRRGAGSFSLTKKNLHRFIDILEKIESSTKLIIACTANENKQSNKLKRDLVKFGNDLGRSVELRFQPLLPLGKAKTMLNELNHRELSPFEAINFLGNFNSFKDTCGLGWNLNVAPDGDVTPCHAFQPKGSFIGNLFRKELEMILKSPVIKFLQDYSVNSNTRCKSCIFKYICFGSCQAWNKSIGNLEDISQPPSFCQDNSSPKYRQNLEYLKIASDYLNIDFDIVLKKINEVKNSELFD